MRIKIWGFDLFLIKICYILKKMWGIFSLDMFFSFKKVLQRWISQDLRKKYKGYYLDTFF